MDFRYQVWCVTGYHVMSVTGKIIKDNKIRFKLEFELESGEFEALRTLTVFPTRIGNELWGIDPLTVKDNLMSVMHDMHVALEKIRKERNTA